MARRSLDPARLLAAYEDVEVVDDRLVHQVAIADIRPSARNPRRGAVGIEELAASLAEHGLLQPVVVRRLGPSTYELIAGHRRFEAAKQLGWTAIAAAVRDETDDRAYILTLVENLQREGLKPREEAAALEVLLRRVGSTRKVASAIHKSAMYVSRRLRVFEDPAIAPLVLKEQLRVSTAEELLQAPDDQRPDLAARAAAADWTPAEARRAVAAARCNGPLQRDQSAQQLAERVRALREELADLEAARLPAIRAPHVPVASGDPLAVALRDEIIDAWRLMHQWRARVAAHQIAGDTTYIWQADSHAHELERRLRALLRVRKRARQLDRTRVR
jgi:ParB family chromosome partitioning protein